MQHHDPHVIDKILKQVESGKLFQHLDKDKHMEMMLEAEKSMGSNENEILKDFERDLPALGKMAENPDWAWKNIQWLSNGKL